MMKNPLRYQMSEYDCGPTAMLNGSSYLSGEQVFLGETSRINDILKRGGAVVAMALS